MTEEEARKLIEPYVLIRRADGEWATEFLLFRADVITLLVEHSNLGLKELEKRIEERIAELRDGGDFNGRGAETFVNQKILSWIVELTEGEVK